MHNDYLIPYFGYLTEVKKLSFSLLGMVFYGIATLIIQLKRPRKDAYQVVYLMLEVVFFAPIVTYIAFSHYLSNGFCVSLLLGLFIYQYNIGFIKLRSRSKIPLFALDYFASLTLFIAIFVVSKFEFNLNFGEIYDIRATYDSKTPGLLRYIVFWSAYFSAPYLFLRGVYYTSIPKIALIFTFTFVQLLLFSIGNNKSFLIIFASVVVYTLYDKRINKTIHWNLIQNYNRYYVGLLATLYAIVLLFPHYYIVASFLFLRTVSLAPRQLDLYYQFVHDLDSPLTYLSQNFPFRLFLHYPHDEVLGVEVSKAVLKIDSNANAAFLFSDGIAAFGIYFGPVVAFLLLNFVLGLVMLNPERNERLRVILIIPYLIQLLNTSIFTTVITGGGLFIVLLGLCVDRGRHNSCQSDSFAK